MYEDIPVYYYLILIIIPAIIYWLFRLLDRIFNIRNRLYRYIGEVRYKDAVLGVSLIYHLLIGITFLILANADIIDSRRALFYMLGFQFPIILIYHYLIEIINKDSEFKN